MSLALCLSVPPSYGASDLLAATPAGLPDAPQPQAGSTTAAQPEPQGLEIVILDGEGALNNIRQRTAREPIVLVEDHNHRPVAGALVLFTITEGPSGAGGTIGGASTFRAVTGADGRARAQGLTPNGVQGPFTVTATATVGTTSVSTIIHQQNVARAAGANNSSPSQGTTGSTTGTTTAGGTSSRVAHIVIHLIPKNPIVAGLVAGGVAAATAVVVVVLVNRNSGSLITTGTSSVTHP